MKYPFSPSLLDALPEELAELFRGLELKLLEEICSRLRIADQLNEVTVQDIRALRSHGIDLEDIEKTIASTTSTGAEKLDKLLDDVVARNQKYYTEMVDLAQVTAPERMVEQEDVWAIYEQTRGQYRNLTQSMGFLVRQGRHRVMLPPARAYQWALDSAELQVMSGAVSYDQAISSAVRELAESGLCVAFDRDGKPLKNRIAYEGDHIDHLDVAVRRAIMTGVVQLSAKYREQSVDYLETDLVETTAHTGARDTGDGPANHKSWQGRVFRWSEKPRASSGKYSDFVKTTGYGTGEGLCGWNCRHNFYPFIEGISERTYTDQELASIDPPPITFEDRTYTAYQATQMQRKLERTIRKQKRLKAAYKAAGLNEDAAAAGSKLNILDQKYRAFSRAAGLPEQRERMRVQYVDDASYAKAEKLLEKSSKSGILKDTGYQGSPITEEAIQRVPLVQPVGWSIEQAERLQAAHRDLLRAVKGKPVGTEAGAVYTTDMRLIERRIGADSEQTISLPRCEDPYISIHNHPSGEIFSVRDLDSFFYNTDMTGMTVVGNLGNVYAVLKSAKYDGFRFGMKYHGIMEKLAEAQKNDDIDGYIRIIADMLRGASDCGLEFIEG